MENEYLELETQGKRENVEDISADLRPIDDMLFNLIYQDKDACQELLRTIFSDKSLIVKSVVAQDFIPNLRGRGVRLDVLCTMSDGSERNVEIQRANNDDHYRRIRYNGSCITASYTPKGTDFKDVIDVYVIYITEFDLVRKGKTVYHIDSVIRETETTIDDGFHRILINAAVNDGTPIARLMSNFMKADFVDEEFPEITKQIQYYKHTDEGRATMCKTVEDYAERKAASAAKKAEREAYERIGLSADDAEKIAAERALNPEKKIKIIFE